MLNLLKITALIAFLALAPAYSLSAQTGKTKKVVEYYPDSVHVKYEYHLLKVDTGYVKHGQYKWYYDDGKIKAKAWFSMDERDSVMTSYFHSGGEKEEVRYRNGKLHGTARTYFPGGAIEAIGEYVEGRKNGVWKFYESNGSLSRTENWDNGRLVKE